MKTLIKRLFGITKLENELAGTWAELEATNLALITTRCQLAIARAEREGLRESLVKMTQAKPGPWKLTKDKTKRYRVWEYPHCRSMWRTESEEIEQCIPYPGLGLPCDGFEEEMKEPDYILEDRACRGAMEVYLSSAMEWPYTEKTSPKVNIEY